MSINQTLPNIYRSPDPKLSHFLLSVVNREDAARPRSGNTRSEFLLWTQKWIMWEVVCPVHGLHHVNQKTEPIVCKIKVQRSPRYIRHTRQCGKRLASALQISTKRN